MSHKRIGLALVGLTLLGGWSIHGFSTRNGFYDSMTKLTEADTLHDGTSYSKPFTGLPPLENLLSTLLTFFWPVLDGSTPELSLSSFLFAGQFTAAWTVTMLEGMRTSNAYKLLSYTTIIGLLVQTMGAALITPAWTALYLLTSLTLEDPTAAALSIPESSLRALPWSVLLGYILPSVAMSLPIDLIGREYKIYAILFWQAFPLWTALFQIFLQNTIFSNWMPYSSAPGRERNEIQLRLLRRCYKFALYIAVTSQIATFTLPFAAQFTPSIFDGEFANRTRPRHVFVPPSPFGEHRVSGVPEGAFRFIQFDFWTTSLAYFVWGLGVKYAKSGVKELDDVVSDVLVRPLTLGFMGAGLSSLWDRDEAVFGPEEVKQKKNN